MQHCKRNKKMNFPALFVALLALTALAAAVTSAYAFASPAAGEEPFALETHVAAQQGNWTVTGDAASADNAGDGDRFLVTDIRAEANDDVVMAANLSFRSGNGTGFAFGITDPQSPGTHWYSLNLFRNSDTDAYLRLFSVGVDGGIGDTLNHLFPLSPEKIAQNAFALELRINDGGTIRGYLDGVCVVAVRDPAYTGGHLGLITYHSAVDYTGVSVSAQPAEAGGGVDADGFTHIDPGAQLTNTWGNWTSDGDSATAHNPGDGDLFAMADIFAEKGEDLVFEATLTRLNNGNCGSIVFGVADRADPGKGWYGVNLQYGLERPTARMFAVNRGTIGAGLDQRKYELTEAELASKTHTLRVEAYANGILRARIDGKLFADTYDSAYSGGYLGLSTFFGSFLFENMRYKITPAASGTFETDGTVPYDVDGYRSAWTWADWTFGQNRLSGRNIGSGNQFSMSTIHVGADQNFIFEADLAVEGKSAGLGFGISQIDDPIRGWYGLIVDQEEKIARVFSENKGTLGTANKLRVPLTGEQAAAPSVRIRVQAGASGVLSLWLDGVLFARAYDPEWNGGYLGFNTFFANATFSNIKFSIWDQEQGLTQLTSGEAPFVFSPDTYGYSVEVPRGTQTVTLEAQPREGYRVRINGTDASTLAVPLTAAKTFVEVEAINEQTGKTALYHVRVERYFDEAYRPGFHFTEKKTWINDPNGLVYDATTGLYHMFYQYCEGVNNDGVFYWGHATSEDLVHWERKAPAIAPDQNGIIFSGSCVVDEENDSGLFPDSVPPASRLVAFFTYHQENPSIGMAYSLDFGETWQKYGKVIANEKNVYGDNFRDPKVIRAEGAWLMITGGWANVRLFSSNDLLHWSLDSEVKDYFGNVLQSECPDIFPLAVDGDENNVKWVITTAGTSYIVGSLARVDGKFVFNSEAPGYKMYQCLPAWTHHGELYATQSYYNDKNGRRVLVSWMIDRTANEIADKEWNGAQSLPLETKLVTKNGMTVLTSMPVREVDLLRGSKRAECTDTALNEASNPLSGIALTAFDLTLSIELGTAKAVVLGMRSGGGNVVELRYDAVNRVLTLDATRAGMVTSYKLSGSITPENGVLTLRVLLDVSILEIFAGTGEQSFHGFVFPPEDATGMYLRAEGGEAVVRALTLWEMTDIH